MKVTFSVRGGEEVEAMLEDVAKRAKDARPATRKVRDLMMASNRKQFATGGSHLGTPWPANAPETAKRKARKGQAPRPNRATGALQASLSGGKGKRSGATKTGARAGTSLFYGRFAQAGTTKAPARPIVGLTTSDRRKAERIVLDYVVHGT